MEAYAMKTNHPHKKKNDTPLLSAATPLGALVVYCSICPSLYLFYICISPGHIHTYIHGFAYCIKLEFLDINYTLLGVVVAYQTVFLSSRNTTTIIFLCCCVCTFLSSFFIIFFLFNCVFNIHVNSFLFVFCVTFLQLNLKRHDCSSPEGSMAYGEK